MTVSNIKDNVRIEPYPLKYARDISLKRKWMHVIGPRDRRLKRTGRRIGAPSWQVRNHEKWSTVELAFGRCRGKTGWFLAYYGKPETGSFPTRVQAIQWFKNNGR